MEEELEQKLAFTSGDIERLEQSPVWKRIVKDVEERVLINENELLTETDLNKILRSQGDMVACKFFLVEIDLIKQTLEEQKEESENG